MALLFKIMNAQSRSQCLFSLFDMRNYPFSKCNSSNQTKEGAGNKTDKRDNGFLILFSVFNG